MSHDDYDDGLVHPHGWATEPPTTSNRPVLHRAEISAAMSAHPEEAEGHDDGLVHGHAWARSEDGPA